MAPPPNDLGQHLLRDDAVIARIVAAARLKRGEIVLDAGAGHGALTRPIAEAVGEAGRVWAVEVDPNMLVALHRQIPPQVHVVEGDLLQVPIPDPLDAVVANPPFKIAAALVGRIVDARVPRSVLVLPQELVSRLVAKPGTERYGKLTVRVGVVMRADNDLGLLSKRAFNPPPGVECGLLRLRLRHDAPQVDADVLKRVLDLAWPAWDRKAKHAFAPLAPAFRADSAALMAFLKEKGWAEPPASSLPPDAFAAVANHLAENGRGMPPPPGGG